MTPPRREAFISWPGWAHLRFAWGLTILVSVWFAAVFAGANWLTAQRATRMRVHLDAELQIPLIPSFMLVYMSIYVLFVGAPFVLRKRHEIISLAVAQSVTIICAGICFLLIPAGLAFRPTTDAELGLWRGVFHFADRLNLDYNLVPSLHVALSVVCIELFVVHANLTGRILLRAAGVLIALATVLTHQHHLIDAATGYALALAVVTLLRRTLH